MNKLFSSVYLPLLWTLVVGTLCCLPGSMIPSETHFSIPQFDKFVHAGMFGGFVFLWNWYASRHITETRRLLRIFFVWYLLGTMYGIATEFIQKYWIPGRDYDNVDIIADMIGAGIAYGVSNVWLLHPRKC